MLKNNKFLLIMNLLFLVIIIILVLFLYSHSKTLSSDKKITRDQNNTFELTNPILDCEDISQSNGNSVISSAEVNEKVDILKDKYNIDTVSLYYRDLNNGPWIGINESEVFSPASLLKTPVMMAILKYAEDHPDILDKKVLIKDSDIASRFNQNIKFDNLLKDGNKYTLSEIVESMIQKSDNAGVGLILDNIPSNYIGGVFYSVGVPYKDTSTEVNLKVKDYAAFFRVLFNSSYLSREMSERALEILSKSEYKNGLVAGVPSDIKVAHKFGERAIGNIYQLHDCGIIYYPKNPYLLCVMTRGNSFKNQENFISEISKYIYTKISK